MSTIYLVSLGCDKNRVDGETMIGTLRTAGYTVVNDPAQAKAIVVNTCGFIRDAVQESIDLILELSEHKTDGTCQALIIVGCMVARYKDEIKVSIPEADAIVGVGEYENIAAVVREYIGEPTGTKLDGELVRLAARADDITPHIAYIKIAEGCNNHCTYCTIPAIRGPYTSRPIEHILEESQQLVAAGARELVLVAQDTAQYGIDIYGEKRLPELLQKLAETSGATWLRLMYAYPEHITPELIATMAKLPQVCKYIDMPIQHSEDSVIQRMGRAGSRAKLVKIISDLRTAMPDIAIRTTLITGFPGETAEDFKNMYSFVQEVKFDRLGVFPYSREDGTPAATMPKQVRQDVKESRLNRLMALQQEIHFKKQEDMVGRTVAVMVDSQEGDMYTGRTQWDAHDVDATVTFTSKKAATPLPAGVVYSVTISASNLYDLKGFAAHEPT